MLKRRTVHKNCSYFKVTHTRMQNLYYPEWLLLEYMQTVRVYYNPYTGTRTCTRINVNPAWQNTQPVKHTQRHITRKYYGVSVAPRLGHRTSDLAVMGSIPGPGIMRHLGQLSLPSLWVGKSSSTSLHRLGLRQWCVCLCWVASNIVWSHMASDTLYFWNGFPLRT